MTDGGIVALPVFSVARPLIGMSVRFDIPDPCLIFGNFAEDLYV